MFCLRFGDLAYQVNMFHKDKATRGHIPPVAAVSRTGAFLLRRNPMPDATCFNHALIGLDKETIELVADCSYVGLKE